MESVTSLFYPLHLSIQISFISYESASSIHMYCRCILFVNFYLLFLNPLIYYQ